MSKVMKRCYMKYLEYLKAAGIFKLTQFIRRNGQFIFIDLRWD
jgi:hypothetical protein